MKHFVSCDICGAQPPLELEDPGVGEDAGMDRVGEGEAGGARHDGQQQQQPPHRVNTVNPVSLLRRRLTYYRYKCIQCNVENLNTGLVLKPAVTKLVKCTDNCHTNIFSRPNIFW